MMTQAAIPSDAELLRMVVSGDEEAFTALYRRHQGFIYRFALMMTGSANCAEEVTQEVFLTLLRKAQSYDSSRGTLQAYLYGIARTQVLRVLERERSYIPLAEDTDEGNAVPIPQLIALDDPLRNYARDEAARLVRKAVLALPPRYREVIVLCDFQEMSCAEAALTLGCPVGTVNSRLHRGHALLVKKLRAAGKLDSATADKQGLRCFA